MSADKLFGIADTHVHFFAHLGHAGYGIWGKPHPDDPATQGPDALKECLPHCDGPHGHGPGGLWPNLEFDPTKGHLVGGYPEFDGWPKSSTLAHQQAFIEWIRRAYDGGLRLAVCLAVNNELLATRMTELNGPYLPIEDMSTIESQIDAMLAMRDFVDQQEGGAGNGWMQIAFTPSDARRIVEANKLCIIIGVEVAALGGWKTPEQLEQEAAAAGKQPREMIAEMVKHLYGRGVRHFFPLHGTNNAFGGTALFVRNYDASNYLGTKSSFEVEQAPVELGISYRIDEDEFTGGEFGAILGYHGVQALETIAGVTLAGTALGWFLTRNLLVGGIVGAGTAAIIGGQYPCPPKPTNWYTVPGGHINAMGLTPYGEILIEELARLGALIDIDHMGHKTTDAVLKMCERYSYPVVSGHTTFRDLKFNKEETTNGRNVASEVHRSQSELERIRALGGYVSPILAQHDGRDCGCGTHVVDNNSAGSSRSFAQAYLYAHHHMQGERVGLGSDINGVGTLPGPRFGPLGSLEMREEKDRVVRESQGVTRAGQVFSQTNGVRYSTPLTEYRYTRFPDHSGDTNGAPFDDEQRDFWEAIAIWNSGTPLGKAEPPLFRNAIPGKQGFIVNLAAGLQANSLSQVTQTIPLIPPPHAIPLPFGIVANYEVQRAAFLVSHHEATPPHDSNEVKRLVAKFEPVWNHWEQMGSGQPSQSGPPWAQHSFGGPNESAIYEADGALKRSMAGEPGKRERDFDINMDGMAHYGMLPDFLQDLWNIGIPEEVMDTLYHSAEDYIRVWERCEERKVAWLSRPIAAVLSMLLSEDNHSVNHSSAWLPLLLS